MRGFNLILNWAGARGRIGVGAGNTDVPAVRLDGNNSNFNIDNPPTGEISAFSLTVTRYSDSVYETGIGQIGNSDRFSAMLSAVEGMPDAAQQLNLTLEVVVDFVPYTEEQAQAIVEQLRERGANAAEGGLSDAEIQRRYPLLWYSCPNCGSSSNLP